MFIKTQALVLRQTDYRESDRLLTVLTREHGRMTLQARGVRGRASRLRSGCQLLCYSEFTVFENRGFYTIDEAVPLQMFVALRTDLELLSLASYFAQVAEVLAQEDSPNPELLSLTLNAMYALSKLRRPQALVKAAFELCCACLAGYEPSLEGCVLCGNPEPEQFNLRHGVLQCTACQRDDLDGVRLPVRPGVLAAMRHLTYGDPAKRFSFRLEEQSLAELSSITEAYLMSQLERSFSALDFYKSLKEEPHV